MKSKVELYTGTYKNYAEDVYGAIRAETYGEDIGQTSWISAAEYRTFFTRLHLSPDKKVLEIASGTGGPAVFTVNETGCRLTGVDINENGVQNARKLAAEYGLNGQMDFLQADASEPLPFPDESFDVVLCMDSICHLKDRSRVLKEWRRVLKTGGQLLYTDSVVITGGVSNEELAVRSSIGYFLFLPAGENERLLREAGYGAIQSQDLTEAMATIALKWYTAREIRKDHVLQLEETDNFNGLQTFLQMVHLVSSEKRLSRIMFIAESL